MHKDPTEFKQRFDYYKKTGKLPYEAGLPKYEDGTEGRKGKSTGAIKFSGGAITSNMQQVVDKLLSPDTYRQILYENVSPNGGYGIKQNIKDFGKYDPYNTDVDDISVVPTVSNEIWANYLKIPYEKRHTLGKQHMLFQSKYKPSLSKNNSEYTAIKLDDDHKEKLLEETDNLKFGQSVNSEIFADYNLGIHTVGKGMDPKRGEYRSYYDKWDLNPFNGKYEGVNIPFLNKKGDISMGIGNPFEIYDRLYLNDIYGVKPKDIAPKKGDYYGGWIPEIVVRPNKYRQ